MVKQITLECPCCGGANIADCPGGTCLERSGFPMKEIKYMCVDCRCEFGDPNDVNFAEGVLTVEGIKPTDPPSGLNTVRLAH